MRSSTCRRSFVVYCAGLTSIGQVLHFDVEFTMDIELFSEEMGASDERESLWQRVIQSRRLSHIELCGCIAGGRANLQVRCPPSGGLSGHSVSW